MDSLLSSVSVIFPVTYFLFLFLFSQLLVYIRVIANVNCASLSRNCLPLFFFKQYTNGF